MIQLTVALGADRTGQTYEGPIAPDEYVMLDWSLLGTEKDPAVIAALRWITSNWQ